MNYYYIQSVGLVYVDFTTLRGIMENIENDDWQMDRIDRWAYSTFYNDLYWYRYLYEEPSREFEYRGRFWNWP